MSKRNLDVVVEVLEQLAFPAGTSGARRLFLRLPADSDIFDAARIAGYVPVFSEDVFVADSAREVLAQVGETSGEQGLRMLSSQDRNDMFRLFCAATPMNVRSKMGQTYEDWEASSERTGRNAHLLGMDRARASGLQAMVRSYDVSGGRYFTVLCARDATTTLDSLVAAGVSEAGDKRLFTLVPSHDEELSLALTRLGFY